MKIPNTVLYCLTAVTICLIAGVVVLSLAGSDVTELSRLVNTLLNAVSAPASLGGMFYATSAARQASDVAEHLRLLLPPEDVPPVTPPA